MRNYLIFILIILSVLVGCTSMQEEGITPQPEPIEEKLITAEEPEETPEPVYETVVIPLEIRETVYFSDSVIDRYTESTYIEDSSLLERKETYNSYGELIEARVFEYSEDMRTRELIYGLDSKLQSYREFSYNGRGLLESEGFYNSREKLQTLSVYEYDKNGRKSRWNVYGGSNNLLSYTDYLYDDRNRLSELKVYAPDGTLEDGFSYEYAENGLQPIREVQYSPAGAVVDITEFTIENGLIIEKRNLTASGDIEYRFEYTYGDAEELLTERVYSGKGELLEYCETEYRMHEETRLVETTDQ